MNLAEWLLRSARLAPDSPALLRGTQVVADYAAFAEHAAALAGALHERFGVAPGDRVALFLANRVEYLEIMYAAWFAGAAVVPINYKLHPREAAWILADSEAKVVFVDAAGAAALDSIGGCATARTLCVEDADFAALLRATPLPGPIPRRRDDLAWLFYTSGTTGKPKGVMLSNGNLHAMTFGYFAELDDVPRDDAVLYAAPMSHGAGLYSFMHVLRGARHVVPGSHGFDAAEILELAPALKSVTMFAAPTMVSRLVDKARAMGSDGEGLRTIVYGGGPMYLADIDAAVATMGPRFVQIYGQGESPMTITTLPRHLVADRTHPRWRERLGSVGRAQACVEVIVADPEGQALPTGETGEVLARGAPVMLGYWRNPEATTATLRDGWLWTGDMGALDADGFLTLKDRSKDVIITGGTNVYPREVEEALLLHADVAEVSVIGVPDKEWGETIAAFVVARDGRALDPATLDRHCLDHIARFKRPKSYRIVEDLPKNNYGKVLKTELRRRLAGATLMSRPADRP